MKMTVEIPDALFRRAKIRAVERGETMRELVMAALERELSAGRVREAAVPYFVDRDLHSEYARLAKKGAFRGGSDSRDTVSEERDGR